MGTRGYYIFLYKGIYYVFYNHWDSQLDGLGQKLVNEIRTWTDADYEEIKAALEKIPEDYKNENYGNFEGLKKAALDYTSYTLDYHGDISPLIKLSSLAILYVYIINLDRMRFEIGWNSNIDGTRCTQRYWLKSIPEDWDEICYDPEEE